MYTLLYLLLTVGKIIPATVIGYNMMKMGVITILNMAGYSKQEIYDRIVKGDKSDLYAVGRDMVITLNQRFGKRLGCVIAKGLLLVPALVTILLVVA